MPDGEITVAASVAYSISVEPEVGFYMRDKDWIRIRQAVAGLARHGSAFAAAAWAFVGSALSTVVAIITWVPGWAALTAEQQATMGWLWVLLIALAVGSTALAIVCFVAARLLHEVADQNARAVLDDMDAVHTVLPTVVPQPKRRV